MGTCILGIYAKMYMDSKKQAWIPDLFTIISASSTLFYVKNPEDINFSLPVAIGIAIVMGVTQAFASALLKLMVMKEVSLHLLTLPDEELLVELEKKNADPLQTVESIETHIKTKFRCYNSSLYVGLIASVLNCLTLMVKSTVTFSSIMGLLVCTIPIVAFLLAIDAKSNMSSAKQAWAARLFLLICASCLFLLVRNPEKINVPSHVSGTVMVMMLPMLYYARTLLALMKQRESQLSE